MSADTAPAAMPGEEDVARVLCKAQHYDPDFDYDPHGIYDQPGSNVRWKLYQGQARAALALFAPILAEKEREIAWLKADRDNSNSLLDTCRHERNVLQKICAKRADALDAAESRALAAEAALAAERERGARLLVAEYEAQTLCLLPILGEALKWRRRVTEDLKELIPYVAQIAALGAAMEAP